MTATAAKSLISALLRFDRTAADVSALGQMLAEFYRWFTEGFDTVDLQEAKALLDAL